MRPHDLNIVRLALQGEYAFLPLDVPGAFVGGYHHTEADNEETAEYIVPVEWIRTRPREQAIRQKGLFANQNSACELRNRSTLEFCILHSGLMRLIRLIPNSHP